MKQKLTFLSALICAATLTLQVRAEPAAERQYVDGQIVAQQIQAKLQQEGFSPLTKINVEAQDDGYVSLKGEAVSDAEAARAVEIAKGVNGVMGVASEILVKRIQ